MSLTLPPRVTDRAFDRLAEIAALTGQAKAVDVRAFNMTSSWMSPQPTT